MGEEGEKERGGWVREREREGEGGVYEKWGGGGGGGDIRGHREEGYCGDEEISMT